MWVQKPQCFQLHETKSRRVVVKVKVLMTIAAISMKTEMCDASLLSELNSWYFRDHIHGDMTENPVKE